MPTFVYSARDAKGSAISGELDAASRRAALQKLAARQLRPTSVSERGARASTAAAAAEPVWSKLFSASRQSKASQLDRKSALPFLQALRELLACGIQSGDALRMMSSRLSDKRQRLIASLLWDELRQGRSLSESLRRLPRVFDESLVSLVEAGEATGSLTRVLDRLVESMEERKAIANKLVAALAYPVVLIAVSIALVMLFLFFLLPQIQGLLDSLGGDLPAATRLLILVADFLLYYGWVIGLGLVVLVSALAAWRRTSAGRVAFDAFVLRIPGVGRFLRDAQILRLTQVLSLLLENGITMVQSLSMTERSLSNRAMRRDFGEARVKVVEGATLSNAFKATGYFDDLALDIFTVGENTGNVVPALKQMARQYNDRIDRLIRSFLGVLSTGVLLFVCSFVALIAFGIISAVFQLSSSL